jgi:glycerophosphoryl diester phosphodiesterase
MFRFSAESLVIVGHRGSPFRAPENTLESFGAAADEGAAWVELDARRSLDGVAVVVHDATDSDGVPIAEQSADALSARGIAALTDLLASLPAGLGVDIELKNLPGDPDYDEDEQRLALLVADAVRPLLGTRPLLASSFNPLALAALRERLPELPLGLLTVPGLALGSGIELAVEFGLDAVFPHLSSPDLEPEAFAEARQRGLATMVWTVDDPVAARRLAAAGADALCTNDPAGLRGALAR